MLLRADFNLPVLRGGRERGLRREEVAYLVGVSLTWYTWLEQGRNANPSRQVIDALARELRLTSAEHDYILALGGFGPLAPPQEDGLREDVPEHLIRLLTGWSPAPAFALGPGWDIIAWNAAYEALYPGVRHFAPSQPNLLVSIFTDPYVKGLMPHWDDDSAHFVAEFRADYGAKIGAERVKAVVENLRSSSLTFDELWRRHDIERFASRMRYFRHPVVGDIEVEVHRLQLADDPAVSVVVYSPVPGVTQPGVLECLLEP